MASIKLIKTYIENGKEQLKFQFPDDTKILYIEEYIKRKVLKLKPTESVFLYDSKRKNINKSALLGDLVWPKNQ